MKTGKTTEDVNNPAPPAFETEKLPDSKNLTNALLLAWKNSCLYPKGHAAVQKNLENLATVFENYFSGQDEFRLEVKKDRLLCNSDVLYKVSSDSQSEDMVSLLYRDGIQWLEFSPGLSQEELASFFDTLNKYRILPEETEGDIVTGLIDEGLGHISFKAVDGAWEDYPLLDFTNLSVSFPGIEAVSGPGKEDTAHRMEPEEAVQEEGIKRDGIQTKSIADPSISEELWEVTPAEYQELQKMVLEEENWDNTADIFDVLLVILRSQTDQYNFSSVLDFTLEEVTEAVEQGEFGLLLKLFQALHQLLFRDASEEYEWVRFLIDRFFQDLSSEEIFYPIVERLVKLEDSDLETTQTLRQLLLYFSPRIIQPLGQVISRTGSAEVRKMLIDVIEYLSLRDTEPLEKLLDSSDREVSEDLLLLFRRLKGERTNRIFFKMTEHSSVRIRQEGIRVLLERDPFLIQKLFPLIDDPSGIIRREILTAISAQRSSVLENMLLKYIKENFDKKDPDHIFACYEALGHCASAAAIPVLRRILLDQGWNWFKGIGKPVHREGAATALALINTPAAKSILQAGTKSKFKSVRGPSGKALVKSGKMGGKTHG